MLRTISFQDALKNLDLPGLHRNLFSSPEWIEGIIRTYGTKFFVKYIEEDGRVVSYILYSVVKNFLEWKICIASYCDYCDGYVRSADDWRQFFQSLRQEYPQYRIAVRNLRDQYAREAGVFKELSRERFHLLDVRPPIEELRRRIQDSYKAAISQSQRKGVTVRECPRSELKKFYELHLRVRKNKYRVFPQPFSFFSNIWDLFMEKGNGFLLGAYNDQGEFIGGNIFLVCGDTLYYKFNTSRHDSLALRPNNILFWEGIRLAKRQGLSFIDLGSSGHDQTGLIRFKEHVGAQGSEIVHLGFHPEGYKFSKKRILKFATWFFTLPWMPNAMVKLGSKTIYHYLS